MTTDTDNLTAQVLVVDDEPAHAEVMGEALRRMGHVCTIVHGAEDALDELKHGSFDVVVTDLVMEDDDAGLKVLAEARRSQPNAETIMVTAHGDVPTCKAALRQGAYDFIEKPLDLDVFRNLVHRAAQTVLLRDQVYTLKQQVDDKFGLENIIAATPQMQRVVATVKQVAPSDIPVLITGESGTGKELIANAIHRNSKRAKKTFKPLNCAGLSESILESELFGHVKGAFTGAEREREGVFQYADGGTIFLDEIGDMPMTMQAKLLRVLESGEVVRVGANQPLHVNVRLLSATNTDLEQAIKEKRFREDLYYRIRGAHVHLSALRERRDDIPLLVRHFVDRFCRQMDKPPLIVEDDTVLALMRYDWPGNVRQLINVIQNMVLVAEGDRLEPRHVPLEMRQDAPGSAPGSMAGPTSGGGVASLTGLTLEQIEKQAIRNALRLNQGNREVTAKMLGIGERTLYRKLKEYGLK